MKRATLIFALVLALAFAFAGCANEPSSPLSENNIKISENTTPAPPSKEIPTTTEKPTEPPTTTEASTEPPIEKNPLLDYDITEYNIMSGIGNNIVGKRAYVRIEQNVFLTTSHDNIKEFVNEKLKSYNWSIIDFGDGTGIKTIRNSTTVSYGELTEKRDNILADEDGSYSSVMFDIMENGYYIFDEEGKSVDDLSFVLDFWDSLLSINNETIQYDTVTTATETHTTLETTQFLTVEGSFSEPDYVWYIGGDLHKKTIAEWKEASHENKLATCADFIAAVQDKLNISVSTMDLLKLYSELLVINIDLSIDGLDAIDHNPVSDIAALVMFMLEWVG